MTTKLFYTFSERVPIALRESLFKCDLFFKIRTSGTEEAKIKGESLFHVLIKII